MTYCKTLNCEVFLFFVKSSSGFPCGSAGKESACSAGDLGSIPGLERSPGEGKDYPLQYSDLENSMDSIAYGVAKSWTWLSDFPFMMCPSLWKSPKCSTWRQSRKGENDLSSFPQQTIQYHSNPSLCPNYWCQRSWSWMVLWRPTRPSRTHPPQKRLSLHHRVLECKSRKSGGTWSNRRVWPWSTKWSRKKSNRVLSLVIASILFQQHKRWLYTWTSSNGQY